MKQPKLTNDGAIIYCDCGNVHDLTIEYDDDGNPVKVNDEITFVKPKEEDGKAQEDKAGGNGSGSKSKAKPHGFFGRKKPAGKSK